MAGNTKLIGFDVKSSKIKLRRWGEDVMVKVSPESVEAIRKVCTYDLPRKPLPHHTGLFELQVQYDESFGQAVVRMNPAVLERLIGYLRSTPEKEAEFLNHHFVELVGGLDQALEDHRNYTDVDEPGL
jgi:hypothetical protein